MVDLNGPFRDTPIARVPLFGAEVIWRRVVRQIPFLAQVHDGRQILAEIEHCPTGRLAPYLVTVSHARQGDTKPVAGTHRCGSLDLAYAKSDREVLRLHGDRVRSEWNAMTFGQTA